MEEHQDISAEDVTVMPVGELRKRHRVWKSTAGRRGEPKELNRGNHGSRGKLAAACRKVSRHAAVICRKRKLFRRIGTQEICGRRKELTAAGIRTTRCAQVVRRKRRRHEGPSVEQGTQKNQTRDKFARGTRKGHTLGRGQLMRQEGTNATRNRGSNEQLHFGNERTTSGVYRTTIGLEIVKQAKEVSSGLRRIRQWTLWRGRPPKWKKKS
jgi:hypothetical protein